MSAITKDPITEAAIISTSVRISISTKPKNRNASTHTGTVSPTFRVPGTRISSTDFVSLKEADDGAKEPIPRVSRKFATNPVIDVATRFFGCLPFCHSSSPVMPVPGSFSGLARSSLFLRIIRITFRRIPITHNPFMMYIAIKHPSRL